MADPTPAQRETARQIAERIICQIEAQWSVAYLRGYIEESITSALKVCQNINATLAEDLAQARHELDTYDPEWSAQVAILTADLAQARQEIARLTQDRRTPTGSDPCA